MITARQILPSLYQLRRTGHVGSISVCARHSGRLRELAGSDALRAAFPGESFEAFPPLETNPAETHEDAYRRAVDALPPDEALAAASVAKAYCARAARSVTETCVQVHGGIGNTWECFVHVYLRRALLSSSLLGDEGYHLRALAHSRLGDSRGL